jgi:hypothetical protein
MISNDDELNCTVERIAFFRRLVANMRKVESPDSFRLFSNSYLAELEKMNAEVVEYLSRHASEPAPAEAA